jgi:hypothetical protein
MDPNSEFFVSIQFHIVALCGSGSCFLEEFLLFVRPALCFGKQSCRADKRQPFLYLHSIEGSGLTATTGAGFLTGYDVLTSEPTLKLLEQTVWFLVCCIECFLHGTHLLLPISSNPFKMTLNYTIHSTVLV